MLWYERAIVGTLVSVLAVGMASGAGCGRSDDVVGASATTGTSAGGMGTGGGGFGGDVTDFVPCAETSSSATLVPVNMFLAVDKSGSMLDNMKWDNAQAAFISFFQSPEAAGLNVALRFWPDDPMCMGANCCIGTVACDNVNVMCPAGECNAQACGTPQVPIGALSDTAHQQALIDLFNMTMPSGSTPMSAALEGAAIWARNQLMMAPNEKVVVVLVTDGEPNFCNEDPAYISGIPADLFMTDGIPTYAVGLQGSQEMFMTEIAAAGGTSTGFFIGNANAEQDLLNALLAIAGQAAECSFGVPDPAAGEVLDPQLVKVLYTGAMGSPDPMPHVENAAACDPNGGWYYDNNQNPTTITLCPQTCSQVQADTTAQLDVALGCECEVDEDCPGEMICIDHHCVPPCTDDSCPDGFICWHDGRCVPEPGDPCADDSQCPSPLICVRGQCSPEEGRIIVGPFEAVQGGAFTCASSGGSGGSARLTWLCTLIGLTTALMRRRRTR